ncbi:NAD(P)/FAD-dependent oxidoreductase [Halococcus thailandensis]|uniref:FAD dependent oxidoreductase n=1 Tax=Halococcus thailandensis JCM 13552 TaxID=1227457 RepID=M0NF64_9EURY|nr:FAD-binding oxidoreductase [Halococcus thailandensis]EMA56602.1 FAD dependent oxidoreductase [Halococcus thailandensis JCM 13552]
MSYDQVVIGGGIYGAFVSWQLAKQEQDVILVERDSVASGASGGPGKRGVRAGGRDPRSLPLAKRSYQYWASLGEELGADIGYERIGQLEFIEHSVPEIGPTSIESARSRVWLQRQHNITTKLLSAEEVTKMESNLSDRVIGAIYTPDDGIVDHTAATRGVAEAARREGADICNNTEITSVEQNQTTDDISEVVTTDGDTIKVDGTVCLLTNTHAAGFLEKQFDVTLPVWNFTPQVVLTEQLDTVPFTHLVAHSHRTLAMKGTEDDRVMITGGWPARWDSNDQTGRPIPDQVEKNIAQAVAVYPFLEDVAIDRVIADHQETCSIDGLPIIDRVPGVDNFFVGTGWTGHGYAIAPSVSKLLAQWVLNQNKPELLEPFCLDRFSSHDQTFL